MERPVQSDGSSLIGSGRIGSASRSVGKRQDKSGRVFPRRLSCSVFCLVNGIFGFAATTDEYAASAHEGEEVRVSAVGQCGSWPIAHADIVGCEYAELKPEMLRSIREHRADYLARCLRCKDGACVPKTWSREEMTARNLCKRLFMTPIKVPSWSGGLKVANESLLVRFSYSISRRGRVEDIHLRLHDSGMTESQVIKMIENGAQEVRFEPLRFKRQVLSIVNLTEGYTLTGTF